MTAAPDTAAPRRRSVETADAVRLALLLGRIVFSFGATAQRIQDSIACLARYLDCSVETLASYDALLITVNDREGFRTRLDSARGVAGLNLRGVTRVSKLLRELSHARPAANELEHTLCAIRDAPHSHRVALQAFAAAQTPDPAQLSVGVQTLAGAVFISVALVIGVIGPVIILQRQRERL
jgi:uncharacterized membrane protein YjjP (DUF1212 family)